MVYIYQVHKGFFVTEQAVIGAVKTAVNALRAKYPSYKVKLTGAGPCELPYIDFIILLLYYNQPSPTSCHIFGATILLPKFSPYLI